MVQTEIAERIFNALTDEPMTFNKMCRKAKIHPRTARTYLGFIRAVQAKEKIEMELNGFRVVIMKQRTTGGER